MRALCVPNITKPLTFHLFGIIGVAGVRTGARTGTGVLVYYVHLIDIYDVIV